MRVSRRRLWICHGGGLWSAGWTTPSSAFLAWLRAGETLASAIGIQFQDDRKQHSFAAFATQQFNHKRRYRNKLAFLYSSHTRQQTRRRKRTVYVAPEGNSVKLRILAFGRRFDLCDLFYLQLVRVLSVVISNDSVTRQNVSLKEMRSYWYC